MKILMTADAVGGVWTYALELSAALAKLDVEIVLATMGPRPRAEQIEDAGRIARLHLEVAEYRLEWMEDCWDDVQRAGDWLLELADQHAVDLVHLNGYLHAAMPWRRPVVSVAHSCVCSWWQAVHGCPPPAQWNRYRDRVAAGLRGADAIVAPTEAFASEVRRWYGAALQPRVIQNARSLDADPDCGSAERSRVIFACGRVWDEAKNFRTLDRVAEAVSWHTYVAGSAIAPDGRCANLEALRCLGPLSAPDVLAWMRRAAIFVHPTRYEPFGLSVLEAAHAGCALVLADVPSLRELWSDAAVFVDSRDAAALTGALQSLIDAPAQRCRLAAAARARAREFQPERMGAAYMTLYRDLLAGRSRERAVA